MKLTVVGYWGGYPARGEATSSYLLEKDDFTLLIDAGSGSLAQLQNYKDIRDVDAVILSHYHHDHIADIGVLQYALLTQAYVNEKTDILPIYGHQEDARGFEKLTHDYTKGIAYDPETKLHIGPFTITFLRTKHPVPCFGMRITDGTATIVYTADTSYDDGWLDFSKQADLLITDCNFYATQDGSKAGHMTSHEGAEIASKAQVSRLLLSHLPQYGDQTQLIDEAQVHFQGPIHLARAGWTWKK